MRQIVHGTCVECGKKVEHRLHGSSLLLKRQIAWIEKGTLCDKCYREAA